MPTSPYSLIMTAVLAACGVLNNAFSKVVFPLPRKPVMTVSGMRLRKWSRPTLSTAISCRLEVHFQRVQAPCESVDCEYDAAVVDEDVVELDSSGARHLRG